MRVEVGLILIFIILLCAGCSSIEARQHVGATLEEREPEPFEKPAVAIVRGQSVVLQLWRYGGIPVPDAMGGSRLLIELRSSEIERGASIALTGAPTGDSKAYISFLGVGPEGSKQVSGLVRILEVSGTETVADLDLRAADIGWNYKGTHRFHLVPVEYAELPSWQLWTLGNGSAASYVVAAIALSMFLVASVLLICNRDPRVKNWARLGVVSWIAGATLLVSWKVLGAAIPTVLVFGVLLASATWVVLRCFAYCRSCGNQIHTEPFASPPPCSICGGALHRGIV
jgi:hypothetical protein